MRPARPKGQRQQAEIEKGLALGSFLSDPHVTAWLAQQDAKYLAELLNPAATDAELRSAQTRVLAIRQLRADMRLAAHAGTRAQQNLSESRAIHD